MKTYTIIAGVNGTGKSSLTGVLKYQLSDLGTIIDVDKIAAANGGNNLTAGRIAIEKIRSCLSRGVCFTQETTLAGVRTVKTARQARGNGYYIRMFYVGLNTIEDSLERIANRVRKGGHNIPPEDVRRRFAGRIDALTAVLPYCDECTFFDNDNGFVEVGTYRNGEVIVTTDTPPAWLLEIKAAVNE